MGKHEKKRPKQGFDEMTSLQLTKRHREALERLMLLKGMRMGEAMRYAILYTEQREREQRSGA